MMNFTHVYLNSLLKCNLIVALLLLTFSSCSMVNTLERGNGKNSPSFAVTSTTVTSTKRKQGDQKMRIESNSKRNAVQVSSDSKELYSSMQNVPQSLKMSERTLKEAKACVLEEVEPIEELPRILTNSETVNFKGTFFYGKSITRGTNIRTKQIQKLIPVKSNLLNTNSVNFLKLFPPNGSNNSVFGPQIELFEMDTQEILRTIGWLLIIGGPLLMLLNIGYFDSMDLFIYGILFFVLIGLFYFWAANLYENLDDHSTAYRIGFWLTVVGWPLAFPLIISIPLWIIGAIYDVRS